MIDSEFETHSWIFEPDGSLLDIYIQETAISDWLKLIDFLNQNFKIEYGPENASKIDKEYSRRYLLKDGVNLETKIFSVSVKGIIFKCHFFLEGEIEFDLWPDQIKSNLELKILIGFMKSISTALNKEVILTTENTPSNILIAVNQRDQLKIFSKDEFSQGVAKPPTILGGLNKTFHSCLYKMLKLIRIPIIQRLLTKVIVELSGANRPHVASKKKKSPFEGQKKSPIHGAAGAFR